MDNAYDPVYGARPLKRYIQKYVETLAAKMILADQVDEGDTIVITVEDDKLSAKCEKGSKNKYTVIRKAKVADLSFSLFSFKML